MAELQFGAPVVDPYLQGEKSQLSFGKPVVDPYTETGQVKTTAQQGAQNLSPTADLSMDALTRAKYYGEKLLIHPWMKAFAQSGAYGHPTASMQMVSPEENASQQATQKAIKSQLDTMSKDVAAKDAVAPWYDVLAGGAIGMAPDLPALALGGAGAEALTASALSKLGVGGLLKSSAPLARYLGRTIKAVPEMFGAGAAQAAQTETLSDYVSWCTLDDSKCIWKFSNNNSNQSTVSNASTSG
jgi:hypothetical protein